MPHTCYICSRQFKPVKTPKVPVCQSCCIRWDLPFAAPVKPDFSFEIPAMPLYPSPEDWVRGLPTPDYSSDITNLDPIPDPA